VFARRVGVRDPHWNPELRRFDWKRVVLASIPAHVERAAVDEIALPWPEPEEPPKPKVNTVLDTPSETVLKITYQPPTLTAIGKQKPGPADEGAYIKTLFNPSPRGFDESRPMELHLMKELSNPHGRAKKQARWQAARQRKTDLLKKYITRELLNQGDRTAREARAEAVFKWRQQMEEERRVEKKRRWFTAERLARIARKAKRKQRKAEKQKERLTQLVLKEAPNQVIPTSSKRQRA
ncbi:hypothetical protein ID866_8614, partial [Astraeus odoratus]